jgi:O-antigen/teichoic acid export membrane protein
MQIKDPPLSPDKIKLFWKNSLYRNASYLIIGNAFAALTGFIFWVVAARLYSTTDVGTASAAISVMAMLGGICHLGLGLGLVRFLPGSGNRGNPLINTSLTLSLMVSMLATIIFVMGIDVWSPKLGFLKDNIIYFFVFMVYVSATALGNISDNVFVAERRSGFVIMRAIVFGLGKLILAVALAGILKTHGLLNSWGIMLTVSVFLALIIFIPRIRKGYRPGLSFNWREAGELIHFSIVNNISLLMWSAPTWILPLIMLNQLGAEANAYFYIAWTIGTALTAIPLSVATALFAEGANEEKGLETKTIRSLSLLILALIPVVVLITLLGDKLLLLFGQKYAGSSFRLLQYVTLALLPLTVNQIYFSVLRVQKRLKALAGVIALITGFTLTISIILLPFYGINGAGIGWLAGQTITAIWVMSKQGWWGLVIRQMTVLLLQRAGQKKSS